MDNAVEYQARQLLKDALNQNKLVKIGHLAAESGTLYANGYDCQ